VPGFSESRRQAFALERFAIAEWKRTQSGDWPHERIYIGWLGQYKTAQTLDVREMKTRQR